MRAPLPLYSQTSKRMPSTLKTIIQNDLCHGCGACAAATNGRISMRLNDAGFLRPVAEGTLSEEDDAAVGTVCSGLSLRHDSGKGITHPIWGPIIKVRTGFSNDEQIRFAGSSGGVISAIAAYLIETGTVEFVLQVGADSTDPFGSVTCFSRSRTDVISSAGSRYGPSAPLVNLEQHLARGSRFAVVGKPCDIASLRRMAIRDPRVDRQVPYMIAFMCAGVPSRKGAIAVASAMGALPEEVERFAFRGEGWPGSARAYLRDGRTLRMDYATSWGTILNRSLQFRCKICPDGTGEFADIVCADAWYGRDGYPDFDERPGRSLLITRTDRGEDLVQLIASKNHITIESLDVAEVEKMQPYQADRKRMISARLLGISLAFRRIPRYRNMGLIRAAATAKPLGLIRNALGSFRRSRIARDLAYNDSAGVKD